jgi:hypothetical protein
MALLSDDAVFYLQVGTLWMLSATAAVTILRGWIRGHGFHPKTSHLFVLGYSLVLAQDALRLLLVHGNIPKVPPWARGLASPAPLFLISRALARFAGSVCVCLMGGYRGSPTGADDAPETPACRLSGNAFCWRECTSGISRRSPTAATP